MDESGLHLRSDPQATTDLAVAELPLATVTAPAFYRFSFPPVPDSHNRYFYAFLDVGGSRARFRLAPAAETAI